ncbi:PQQ-binding-like beta-propeller repeat protein [Sphingobacterium sp. DK4209]|uniref:PQQ-binding-like beta-propeller repeat protein n=1 Tax=Sphingobacterium zhuxiongii TaxID=2662364 RepID=A0A5Q0Q506_9SPHI|nr:MULTISPECIES: PQQ-binding-like beta-propeller repeat protein [unclassified Sphingobacterium]MVZ66339.1 PQQ-binding-like beta-propeller repeat protein [Sphingobacterium sp. DK4209]QGA25117.1 PQQ-binding-like beta-propeller repeat protein [Sphingobacterium sp. dk4302]
MKRILFLLLLVPTFLNAQSFRFAQVTDTHVGGATGADDLRRTVQDLNQMRDIDFVILSGDVTEFGSDEELALAKRILDSLNLPLYVIPGNHDSNWSESGANTFRRVFGSEMFFFKHKGYQFIGTTSGPNMRMSPGQIPRENLVWMDSVFNANKDAEMPLIAINHYPLDESLNNWYESINRLKTRNVQLALCGHGHQNRLYDWEGIPGVMSRSNLRAKEVIGGYNIITIKNDSAIFQVRRPLSITEDAWLTVPLRSVRTNSTNVSARPNYDMNNTSKAKLVWEYEDHGDIGAGMSTDQRYVFTANTVGEVFALDMKSGKLIWKFKTGGKVYSTPAFHQGTVVVGSSDHFIYGLDSKTGLLKWKLEAGKAVLGSAAVDQGKAYIGASDGIFRCINVSDGKLIWAFDQVKGYVSTRPTIANDKVIFGSWNNGFYALDKLTGKLVWEWSNGHQNRMFSAAACYPVVSNNRVFIVAPDRYMTAIDLKSGKTIWREKIDSEKVRESMGLSHDKKHVYAKTMDGEVIAVPVHADKMDVVWKSKLKLPYELAPTALQSNRHLIFVPSDKGLFSAVDNKSGEVKWQYKISNGMINPPLLSKNSVIVSTMDGKIVMLSY